MVEVTSCACCLGGGGGEGGEEMDGEGGGKVAKLRKRWPWVESNP